MKVILRAPRVNMEKSSHELGRAPSRCDIAGAVVVRAARAVRELLVIARDGARRRR